MKGIFEFEVSGQKRGFKFGTYGISVACEKENCTVDVLLRRCGIPYLSNGKPKADDPKLKALLHLFYGAAIHYAEDHNHSIDFKTSTVSNWLDEIGMDGVQKMMAESFTQYVPKNLSSPVMETGEKVTA